MTALEGRNKAQYGENVTLESILGGEVKQPSVAKELYASLEECARR